MMHSEVVSELSSGQSEQRQTQHRTYSNTFRVVSNT
jgi:hypothetical protein